MINNKNVEIFKNVLNLNEKIKKHLPYIFQNPYRDTLPKSSDLMEYYRENQFYYRKLNELKRKCKKNNLHIYFLTLSVPHNSQRRLDSLNKILEISINQLLKSKTFKDFENKINIKFRCLKFEVDISDKYGFNPHNHYLIIAENDLEQKKLTEIELKLSTKYYNILISNKAINSQIDYWLKEEYIDGNNVPHKGHILNIQKDFNYLSYIADNSKILEKHLQNLESKNFSVYQLPLIYSENINYDNLFLQYVDFMKSKQKKKQRSIFSLHFDFSNRYFLDIDFKYEKIKEKKRKFSDYTFIEPNLDVIVQKYKRTNYLILPDEDFKREMDILHNLPFEKEVEIFDKIEEKYKIIQASDDYRKMLKNRKLDKFTIDFYYEYSNTRDYLSYSAIFLSDKLMKHYRLDRYFLNEDLTKKFKIWVNFISNIDFYNFVGYIHENIDVDCLRKYENTENVPQLVMDLVYKYRDFYQNLKGYEEYKRLDEEKFINYVPDVHLHIPDYVVTNLQEKQYLSHKWDLKCDYMDDFLLFKPSKLIDKFKNQKPNFKRFKSQNP